MKVSLGTISFMGKEGQSIDQIIMNIKDNGLKTRKMDMDAKQQGQEKIDKNTLGILKMD